jgi:type VI protein secretion system component VasK
VVPPNSELWVTERTAAYMGALSRLRGAIQKITASSDPAARAAAVADAIPVSESALDAVRQLGQGFKPNGLDQDIQRLLKQPIERAAPILVNPTPPNPNDKLTQLCRAFGNTFDRYPFRKSSGQDATIAELTAWFAPGTGHAWTFQADALGQLTQIENAVWKAKDPTQKPQVTPEMLGFLNRAQLIKDGFFPKGASQPQISYSLRPKLDERFKASTVEVEIDGQLHRWTNVFQKQFTWPAAAGEKPGAVARIRTENVAYPFTSHPGVWGIFRMMADAEPRAPLAAGIEWKYARTGEQKEEIQPAPVRMEFPEFPNGVDVFQTQSFDGMKCPAVAVR